MKKKSYIALLTVLFLSCLISCNNSKKELYLPEEVEMVPKNNDYSSDTSTFCFKHMVQSENIALFWHKEYGDDPMNNPDLSRRFAPQEALQECERFYDYYLNELKMVEKGNTLFDKYKLLIYVFGGDEGTAFAGGTDNKVGILWTPATRINKKPYGTFAHEMGHCFQYISNVDVGTGATGPIIEMSAQYMLWQVYPNWMTFENYHLDAFMDQTHYAFLHPTNMYHSPYVLEYWTDKHGKEFLGELFRKTKEGEDPVATYKRINSLTQDQFNDEMFDASRHFITWDLKRVQKEASPYANQHKTSLIDMKNGWYRIDSLVCPQNYGYNGIKLEVPEAGTEVTLNFQDLVNADGYTHVKSDKAGWRYGFLASLTDGSRVYGDMGKNDKGTVSFKVPEHTQYLWLVVMGAPKEHWPIIFHWGAPGSDEAKEEQWPYKIKLTGTNVDQSALKKK